MRRNKTHILNEVSAEFAGKALKSAIERINRLATEFAESDFKDTEILAKLQKLALQRNRFTDYINDANNEAADQVVGPLKRVIKKWGKGRTLSNGVVFKPLFTLKSEEVLTREVVKQRWGSDVETYNKDVKDIPFSELIVIGLNSDFDALIKAGKKFNMDYSQYEQLHDEYDAINKELKDDLLAINGISYSWSKDNRRNKRNPYDTITMIFYIDTDLIDTEIMSQKLGGDSFYDTDYRKTAGSCGGTKDGIHYSGVPYGTFKTRRMELHTDEKLNNEKRNNKALYEQIMRNVSREVKKVLNESIDLDRRFQIRQQIYSYFEKEARDAWYQGCLEDPHEQDWYIEDYKRNFWSYYTDDLYSYVYRCVYNIDKSISYEDVTNYIKRNIGSIDIDKIIEEAHYDIIEELGE